MSQVTGKIKNITNRKLKKKCKSTKKMSCYLKKKTVCDRNLLSKKHNFYFAEKSEI